MELNLKDVFNRYIQLLFNIFIVLQHHLFYNRSYHIGDSKVQRIFGTEALAKRQRKELDPRVVACLVEPDAQLLLPPPPLKEKEQEMMDLDWMENEE